MLKTFHLAKCQNIMDIILGGSSGELNSCQKKYALVNKDQSVSFYSQPQPNHLSDILRSLSYSDPKAIFGDTYKVYKDKPSPCCMSDKQVEKIQSEL